MIAFVIVIVYEAGDSINEFIWAVVEIQFYNVFHGVVIVLYLALRLWLIYFPMDWIYPF